jgi:hypothetical protein
MEEKGKGFEPPWQTKMYTGDGANNGEPGAIGEHTREEKLSMT